MWPARTVCADYQAGTDREFLVSWSSGAPEPTVPAADAAHSRAVVPTPENGILVPLSVSDTCARVVAELNPPGQPFTYRCEGNRVIGTWDIADVTYQGLLSAGTIDKDYELTVTLDGGAGTYTFTEKKVEGESDVRFRGGTLEFGGSKQAFKGKSIGKQWGGGAALRATSHGRSGHTWSYEFETSRIKEPLLALLHQLGWQPARKGFFARLFSN